MWFTLRNTLRRGRSAVPLTLARTRVCRFSRSRIFSFIPHLAPVDFRPTGNTRRNARHECLLYLHRISADGWVYGCMGVWVSLLPHTHTPIHPYSYFFAPALPLLPALRRTCSPR